MVWFKQCKKCHGDLYLESDRYGAYVACIQCGTIAKDIPTMSRQGRQEMEPARMPVPAAGKRLMAG